jgi:hypothetical protein
MSGFIPDASVTLPWRFDDEATPWTEALLSRIEGGDRAHIPAHFHADIPRPGRRFGSIASVIMTMRRSDDYNA